MLTVKMQALRRFSRHQYSQHPFSSRLLLAWLLIAAVGAVSGGAASAVEQHPAGPKNNGIKVLGLFQIFPENRRDNGVYFKNRLVFTLPGSTIVDVAPIGRTNRFLYIANKADGSTLIEPHLQSKDRLINKTEIAEGVFYFQFLLRDSTYRKLFRLTRESIQDLLPISKTAAGPISGSEGIVFYHISAINRVAGGQEANQDGGEEAQETYTLMLHFVPLDGGEVRHLPTPIISPKPWGRLRWVSKNRLRFDFGEETGRFFTISQFR